MEQFALTLGTGVVMLFEDTSNGKEGTEPKRIVEILEKLVPEREIVPFCGALVGVNVVMEKVVLVKLVA